MRAVVVETVHDLDEFLSLISPDSRIHHECYWKYQEIVHGLPLKVEAGIIFYGITREGFVVKCIISDRISWNSIELDKKYSNFDNIFDKYNAWITEKWQEYEEIAKKIEDDMARQSVLLPDQGPAAVPCVLP